MSARGIGRSLRPDLSPATALAAVVIDELVALGVRHIVLCPGSRSAPLAYAVAARDDVEVHVRVDERSAAFLALGLAKLAGPPAAIITTSGTAVANLVPAVLEAHEAGVPLLLLTADRPPELRNTRANQTTDQLGVFVRAVCFSHDLVAPDLVDAGRVRGWRAIVDRAAAAAVGALGGQPGPVHLNVALREPLVPSLADGTAFADSVWDGPGPADATRSQVTLPWSGNHGGGPALDLPERTVIVLGEASPEHLRAAVPALDALGWPVVAEPFGPRPRSALPHGHLAVDLARRREPDAVLVVGHLTLTRPVAAFLRNVPRVCLVTDQPRWPDPSAVVADVHPWAALLEAARDGGRRGSESWRAAAVALTERVRPVIDGSWPSGPSVATTMLASMPEGAVLFAGSSNAARDLDVARTYDNVEIVGSRGLAGIDGCVSTAAGLALASGPDRPTYALMGDLTFLHDTNGLLVGPHERRPDLTIVVVDDRGGGIFQTLEYGDPARLAGAQAGVFERFFTTPTDVDLSALCAAHGVEHTRVDTADQLRELVATPPAGLRVAQVVVPRDHRALLARLRSAARIP